MHLGTCYYPEHWPRARWPEDARQMRDLGISHVRIGEFAWSRIEPARDDFRWSWLDDAITVLGEAGLLVILCTPTATPPKWLVDERPDILPTGRDGRTRGFGSRRHYSFSSPSYREESRRITRAVASRYGENPHIVGWQTDNEYGCHSTVRDYGPSARNAFRIWLEEKYGSVVTLNAAWGNVFWSMEYGSFSEVEVPAGAVTETNPAHRLDFARFSSDQVLSFDAEQCAILRELSPGRWLSHNVMGISLDFDHFALGRHHDMLAWDSYPLGFLEQSAASEAHKLAHMRAGDPDFQAFHHDLYRNCSSLWGVAEQQNGPVNWAPHNPLPREGQVKLWTEEARAHGAGLVSYFRWRQLPFAQEQNHSGLLDVDAELSAGGREVADLPPQNAVGDPVREVALMFSYDAQWMFEAQPQGAGWSYWELVQLFYRAARRLGLNIDVVSPDADLAPYALALVPSLPVLDPDMFRDTPTLFGPRTGSKTADYSIPSDLPPGPLRDLVPCRIPRWESLRPGAELELTWQGRTYPVTTWREDVEAQGADALATVEDRPALLRHGHHSYLAVWPDEAFLLDLLHDLAAEHGLRPERLPGSVRTRRTARGTFASNYGPDTREWRGHTLAPSGTVWSET